MNDDVFVRSGQIWRGALERELARNGLGEVAISNQSASESAVIVTVTVTVPSRNKDRSVTLPPFVGTSRRHPNDQENAQIGYELALGRALRQAGRRLLRDANRRVYKAAKARQVAETLRLARQADRAQRAAELTAEGGTVFIISEGQNTVRSLGNRPE